MIVKKDVPTPIGWLLLKKGHAVPISGLSPDDLKAARGSTIKNDGEDLKYTSGLNAIVDSLGFRGDFGKYKNEHWDRLQRLMAERGLARYKNLFRVPTNYIWFHMMERQRRALADRIFLGPGPRPKRVFIGYGHDWDIWEQQFSAAKSHLSMEEFRRAVAAGSGRGKHDGFFSYEPSDMEEAREWLHEHSTDLMGIHNFIGDQLLDFGSPGKLNLIVWLASPYNAETKGESFDRACKVTGIFRRFIDQRDDGWVEVIPVTDRLALLKGPNGFYDLLWRDLRETPPPIRDVSRPHFLQLHPLDTPSRFLEEGDFDFWNYSRHDVWEDKERCEAEMHYYRTGGRGGAAHIGPDAVLERFLRFKGEYGEPPRLPRGNDLPPGFHGVIVEGKPLFVSHMVTVGDVRRFAAETGYFDRRDGESWAAANDDNPDTFPVGATFCDALAYCAWMERKLGLAIRLLTAEEHRALRPFASDHYEGLASGNFPWERYPPRQRLLPSVTWSEPRYLEPSPEVPEFPHPSGLGGQGRKRWIADENWPPRAMWKDPLPWVEYQGLQFIDAWDAYELCDDGRIAGRYWEGSIVDGSWGEYRAIKLGFRMVIEQETETDTRGEP